MILKKELFANWGVGEFSRQRTVIPAKAGIQNTMHRSTWMPACAGMTEKKVPDLSAN